MADKVAIPDNADEAALMVLTGVAWLKYNAPERLTGDEYKKDAERYRWLRNNPQWLGWDHDFRPDEVEREIDAAMLAAPGIGAA